MPSDLSCFVSSEARVLRAGGLAELVGDIKLTCSSPNPKNLGGYYDIHVFTSLAQITNRIVRRDPITSLTDAFVVDHLGRTIQGVLLPNMRTGDAANTRNCLLFPSVCVSLGTYDSDRAFHATGQRTLIVKNIRVAAPALSNTSIPSTVFCRIDVHDTFTAAAQVVENQCVSVGTVRASFDFSIIGPNGETNQPLSYQLPLPPSEAPEPFSFSVCFKEPFIGALKSLPEEAEYGSEQGIGLAHHGTRLRVRFRNLPPYFRIAVTETDLEACNTPDGSAGAVLRSPEPRQKSREQGGPEYTQLQVTVGEAIAEWECIGVRKSSEPKEIRMGVRLWQLPLEQAVEVSLKGAVEWSQPNITSDDIVLSYGRLRMSLPNHCPVAIDGCLAPVSTVDYASEKAQVPRFLENPQGYQAVYYATYPKHDTAPKVTPEILVRQVPFYSCFISHSTKDQTFAERLYTDLQANGVPCWCALYNIQAGKKLHEQIDEAIRRHDRLLLILSEHSMNSEWVKTEIAQARQKERNQRLEVLFPISLVPFPDIREWKCFDADIGEDLAREIREYFIPDFSNWKDHDSYQQAFQRLLSDLKNAERTPGDCTSLAGQQKT